MTSRETYYCGILNGKDVYEYSTMLNNHTVTMSSDGDPPEMPPTREAAAVLGSLCSNLWLRILMVLIIWLLLDIFLKIRAYRKAVPEPPRCSLRKSATDASPAAPLNHKLPCVDIHREIAIASERKEWSLSDVHTTPLRYSLHNCATDTSPSTPLNGKLPCDDIHRELAIASEKKKWGLLGLHTSSLSDFLLRVPPQNVEIQVYPVTPGKEEEEANPRLLNLSTMEYSTQENQAPLDLSVSSTPAPHSQSPATLSTSSIQQHHHQFQPFEHHQLHTQSTAPNTYINTPFTMPPSQAPNVFDEHPLGLPPMPYLESESTSNLRTGNWNQPKKQRRASPTPNFEQSSTHTAGNDGALKTNKVRVPDEKKDDAYWEKRRKNNEAAKRSRDARRQQEEDNAVRHVFLERENLTLKAKNAILNEELRNLQQRFYDDQNREF